MGKHSKVRHRSRQVARRGVIEMVDARTGENHLLTVDAAAAGRRAPHRYRALYGTDIIPAALVDPGTGRYCGPCRSGTVPAPRTGR
jgi:hypothetical protein